MPQPSPHPHPPYRIDYYQKPHNSPSQRYEHIRSLYYDTYQEALEVAKRANAERDEYCVIVDRTKESGKGIVFVV